MSRIARLIAAGVLGGGAVTVSFTSAAVDARVRGAHATYATARTTSTEFDASGTETGFGQSTGFEITRALLKFDTSSIPDTATILSATLTLTATTDSSDTDFDVVIRKHDWSAQDPVSAGNREAAYDGVLAASSENSIWRNTSGIAVNTPYTSGALDTTRINKTGATYYSLISSRDIAGNQPAGNEFIVLALSENATAAYRPILNVTYRP